MPTFAGKFHLYSAYERPDLVEALQDPLHPLERAWPVFVQQTLATKLYWEYLTRIPELAKFQLYVTVNDSDESTESLDSERIIARAHAIPFHRSMKNTGHHSCQHEELETLPNGGWDSILKQGVLNHLTTSRHKPENTLSALSITIDPNYRRQGIAECLIETMKEKARQAGFLSLVVPLRPTMKSQYPEVDMDEYARWTRQGGIRKKWPSSWDDGIEPFDPWLRRHVSLGAQMIKVAPQSMSVEADLQSWITWMGPEIEAKARNAMEKEPGKEVVKITVAGGLSRISYYPRLKEMCYVEANIWVQYNL